MKPVVFVGPTLSGDPVLRDRAFRFLPPAGVADVYRAAKTKPVAIGLIDGVYENQPAVWHKEILWALSRGVHVFGAASMGALRAAELAPFGMVGVGRIFEQFRDGVLEDDDEVAVIHAPKQLHYAPLSEAMVDIRATLARARGDGVISKKTAAALERTAKAIFFKERDWNSVLNAADLPKPERAKINAWLPAHRVPQKRLDALAMLEAIRRLMTGKAGPFRAAFTFQRTVHWQALTAAQRR